MSSEELSTGPPPQSPFFRALQRDRYERQEHIRRYEDSTGRSLVVFCGPITPEVIAPFADAINDVDKDAPLDLMLTSFGGDGETALRMASMCHTDRKEFRVIVPGVAASAATLLALAAESIVMSSTSALGPVDPQVFLPLRKEYIPAKDIIQIVNDLDERTKENPQAFELYAALLADVDAIIYQRSRAAISRTEELVPEVLRLRHNPPSEDKMSVIIKNLQSPAMHSAAIGHTRARDLGLTIEYIPAQADEWDCLWRLHAYYVVLLSAHENLVEGRRVSFQFG